MRKPGGWLSISAPDKRSQRVILNGTVVSDEKEADTFSCGHCQRVVVVKPMQDPADVGGLCKCCMTLICPQCYGLGACTPIEKKIEQQEDRGRFLRQMQEWG